METEERNEIIGRVRAKYPDIPFPNVYLDPIWRGIDGKEQVEGKSAVVMELNGEEKVTAVCTDQYKVVEHEIAVDQFERVVNSFEEYGKPSIGISLLSEGAKLSCTATFPECATKVGKDLLRPKAGIKNSIDLGWEYESWFGAMVERCTNGLLMFKRLINGRQKHRLSLDLGEHMHNMSLGMGKMSEQYQIWNGWSKVLLDKAQAETLLDALPISETQTEKILELPEMGTGMVLKEKLNKGAKVSGWQVNSLVTQYFSNEVNESASRINTESAISEAMHKQMAKRK